MTTKFIVTTKNPKPPISFLLGGCTSLAMLTFIQYLVVTTENSRILYQMLIP
jgi:hypothetical protein